MSAYIRSTLRGVPAFFWADKYNIKYAILEEIHTEINNEDKTKPGFLCWYNDAGQMISYCLP